MKTEELLRSERFRVERLAFETPAGESISKDVVRHPGSVAIVPLLDDGRICLIRNHRVTVGQTLIEIPAGTMEPPEPPLECARRELIEETGFRAKEMKLISRFFPAPGILDEEMHLFLATGLEAGPAAREAGEMIENHIVTVPEALALLADGHLNDAKTMLGILFLQNLLPHSGNGPSKEDE